MNEDSFEVEVHGKYDAIPSKAEEGSVGYDISIPEEEGDLVIPNNCRRIIDTGIVIQPPETCFELVVLRSSSYNQNIRISNTVGVIDPSYCGQDDTIMVSIERGPEQYEFKGKFNYLEKGYKSPRNFIARHYMDSPVLSTESRTERSFPDLKWEVHEEGLIHIFEKKENDPVVYEAGERFCQVLFLPFHKPNLVEKELDHFRRENRGGFGSTGS